ncbi:methylated-DNA--[protein]-cysteine S-methyltransferase [Aeromonas dhakensis]|uniref:bifunctional transcriptional activator/DNA repair enzyme AdaA n=1 Tax=Aeromonas dhakensis TaxID=196024 RepID=UPI0021B21F30|nr:methylated-DNA--[protein]-cysteine S-methyltransferase [Aeromonas dhakensis]UXB12163.1 methylated-DNA--[protein]-cysteine S-methyltransferase [Aeromonas dhakensis]
MSDYARIADAIRFIASQVARQPTLDEIAAHVHLSPFHFQRLFSRWAGVTPKRYLQVLTLERAKALLQESRPLLEVADTLGLSSGSRLYDHFVQLEAVTPGEYKQRGAGLVIDHGVQDTPFGQAFVALTSRGVCNFSFLDEQDPQTPLAALAQSWPEAELREAPSRTRGIIHTMFDGSKTPDRPISLHVSGTNFQISVWRALLQIPPAKVVSYAQVASAVGNPKAARAVGLAVGANPIAFVIPCHRVIQQNGKLGGYHWGETRKQAIHAWEAARYE